MSTRIADERHRPLLKRPLQQAVADGMIVTWRNLKRVPRIPELAIFAILQSIMFVLLFAFVFGGAIPLPGGGSYREFLMPGIFAQTICFRRRHDSDRDDRRCQQGHHRPLPVSPDGPLGCADRARRRRRCLQRRYPARADALGPGGRLARPQQRPRILRWSRPAAAVRASR